MQELSIADNCAGCKSATPATLIALAGNEAEFRRAVEAMRHD